jgi:hypothetical protein
VLDPATLIKSKNRSSSVICSSTLRARTSAGASCVASRHQNLLGRDRWADFYRAESSSLRSKWH